jgi:hypothetical protein
LPYLRFPILRVRLIAAMAEAREPTSGLLKSSAFASKRSITLWETIQSYGSLPGHVHSLVKETQDLSAILSSLANMLATTTPSVDLSALEFPLLRCGNHCKEFEQKVVEALPQSGSSRTRLRIWDKLTYMGDDVNGFEQVLAGYKIAFIVALTYATL